MSQERIQILQARLQAMEQQLMSMERSLMEIQGAISALDSMDDAADVLVPIGGGVHVPATLQDAPVVAAIGAETAVERSRDEAKAALEEQAKRLETDIEHVSGEASKIAPELQKLYEALGDEK